MSTDQVMKAVERLMKVAPKGSVNRFATRMHQRLRRQKNAVSMQAVLNELPGGPTASIASKARLLGVSRQTVYAWANGDWRPDEEMAQKLEKLTGFSAAAIRGDDDPA